MKKFIFTLLILTTVFSYSQMGVGTATPNANAILELESQDKGFLLPSMTTAERNTLGGNLADTDADKGMMVYDHEKELIYVWSGRKWKHLKQTASYGLIHSTTPSALITPDTSPVTGDNIYNANFVFVTNADSGDFTTTANDNFILNSSNDDIQFVVRVKLSFRRATNLTANSSFDFRLIKEEVIGGKTEVANSKHTVYTTALQAGQTEPSYTLSFTRVVTLEALTSIALTVAGDGATSIQVENYEMIIEEIN